MDLKEIQDLIRFVSKSGVTEVEVERDGFKIVIKAEKPVTEYHAVVPQQVMMPAQAAVAAPAAAPIASPAPAAVPADSGLPIKSPMIGTFYRSAGPDKEPFVKVGDRVEKGQVVCIIEAMKLFNEIESEVAGVVTKVLVENASPVEYDQPLFLVDPA
ncbi:MAG: acetyl-CoA carboxylase biotin carboxyl carrier protein [Bacteroidia bacterium]